MVGRVARAKAPALGLTGLILAFVSQPAGDVKQAQVSERRDRLPAAF